MGPLNAASEANTHLAAVRNYARYFTPFKFEPNLRRSNQIRQNAEFYSNLEQILLLYLRVYPAQNIVLIDKKRAF